jgi:chromosome segregation ATPase
MDWLKSKTTIVVGSCFAVLALGGYGMKSMHNSMEQRIGSLEREILSVRSQNTARLTQIASDLEVAMKGVGATTQELQEAHALTQQLKKENSQTAQRLQRELAAKADSKSVLQFKEEATGKLNEVQQDATTKIAGVSGEVQGVRGDLDATREDLANSKRDLNSLIARNSTELAELRKRGERDYVEFDIQKSKQFQRVGDVQVQLKGTDVKRQKFDLVINADDSAIVKQGRTANEPVTFLVGRERVRYELVINYVDKDRIRGYLSTPKDKLIAAESPSFRRPQ